MYESMLQPPENQPYFFHSLKHLQECVNALIHRVTRVHFNTKKFANALLGRQAQDQQFKKAERVEVNSFEDAIYHISQQLDSLDMLCEDVYPHLLNLLSEVNDKTQRCQLQISDLDNRLYSITEELMQKGSELKQTQLERDDLLRQLEQTRKS